MPIYGEPEAPYPERYAKGVWLFNRRHFFECHEILEGLWLESIGTPKRFHQMLIHGAVCFVHWENENRKGVLSLYHTFRQKAAAIPASVYMGLDIARLQADLEARVEPLKRDPGLPLPPFQACPPPLLHVTGFEPRPVDDAELRVLGREAADEAEAADEEEN